MKATTETRERAARAFAARVAFLPANWRRMTERQRAEWQNFGATLRERDAECVRRGGVW